MNGLVLSLRFAGLVAAAAAAIAVAPSAAAAPARKVEVLKGPVAAAIDQQLTQAAATKGFGGAVIVEIAGDTVLKAGYGLADRERKTPFTAQTPAQIGSITKTFTALAVSQLTAEGKLDLNVPVKTYLPGAAEPAASATLNQLMTHTAGLGDYCGDDFDKRSKAELLQMCMAKPLEHPPGTSVYSNMGLSIAAATVEAVSGQSWTDYLRDHIWRPLGMARTGWTFDGGQVSGFAAGYLEDKPQGVISDHIRALGGDDWNLKGNGGLQASVEDMQRFYRGLKVQPAEVRALMFNPHADGDAPDVKEGYGLFFRLDGTGKPYRIGHGGSDGVFFAYFAIFPEKNAFFFFVGNNGEAPVKDELRGVLKAVQTAIGVPIPAPSAPAEKPR